MESHNAALYGPYQPCPIVARDFTANDVTQLKTKLAELVTYVAHKFITLSPSSISRLVRVFFSYTGTYSVRSYECQNFLCLAGNNTSVKIIIIVH